MTFHLGSDEETDLILEIAADLLVQYFQHEKGSADRLVRAFYEMNRGRVENEFYHHESSFRVAAMTHYFCHR